MKFSAPNTTQAFCGAPTPLPRQTRHHVLPSISPRRLPISLRLRNSSRRYNSDFSRSRSHSLKDASEPNNSPSDPISQTPAPSPSHHHYSPNHEATLHAPGGNGAAPPYSGNGHWHGDGSGGDDRQDPVNPEVLAILTAAGRDISSLPVDVRTATTSQLRRFMVVEKIPLLGWLASVWPALRNRLVANERLPIQLGVELSVGFMTKTLAEVQGRGKRFWKEFDFYLSDMALELVGDAMLVWLLSPTALFSASAKTAGLGAFLQGLPKHAGQIGAFSPFQRTSAFTFKAFQFGLVGFFSSMLGHGLTTFLVKQRRAAAARRGEAEEGGVQLAPVVPTSAVWGLFMFLSSNSRYQLVNAFEQRALDPLLGRNAVALTAVTFAVRFWNCFVGGVQWLPFAQRFGIQ